MVVIFVDVSEELTATIFRVEERIWNQHAPLNRMCVIIYQSKRCKILKKNGPGLYHRKNLKFSRDSSVDIVICYGVENRGVGV
jgi:hypothetical protein